MEQAIKNRLAMNLGMLMIELESAHVRAETLAAENASLNEKLAAFVSGGGSTAAPDKIDRPRNGR